MLMGQLAFRSIYSLSLVHLFGSDFTRGMITSYDIQFLVMEEA